MKDIWRNWANVETKLYLKSIDMELKKYNKSPNQLQSTRWKQPKKESICRQIVHISRGKEKIDMIEILNYKPDMDLKQHE